jgi:hypothetical protein
MAEMGQEEPFQARTLSDRVGWEADLRQTQLRS